MSTLKLAENFSIRAIDYANQGNAILGIRSSGKSYTASKAAEELLEAGIPIVVFDPVGIWHNLKVGVGKNKGYSIVTAGGSESDILLTRENAVDVVRAAMKENVSLVIDLFCPELSLKSTWIRIVQQVIDMLLLENKPYGLRHIFIEEAADFCPQKLQPQQNMVYSSIERLARIGRNCGLGYTIINQRAEEVNKAILELCEFSLLHKQVGKNSMLSIQKWMNVLQVENVPEMIKSIPLLKQGESWVVGESTTPTLIQVLPKKTYHPDPKKKLDNNVQANTKVDVTAFVNKLNKSLTVPEVKSKPVVTAAIAADYSKHDKRIKELEQENHILRSDNATYHGIIENLKTLLNQKLPHAKTPEVREVSKGFNNGKEHFKISMPATLKTPSKNHNGNLGKCSLSIARFLAQFKDRSFTKAQVGISTGYSPGSGGFNNALSELVTKDLIIREGGKLQINWRADIWNILGDFVPQQYSIETYKSKLNKCEREIYEVLLNNPDRIFKKEDLAANTISEYSPTSGGFNNALSTLNTLELIERASGSIRLNPELFELIK